MNIAKLTPKQIDALREFVGMCEDVLERQKYSGREPHENWKDWNDEDIEDFKRLKKKIASNDDRLESDVHDREVCYELLRKKYYHGLSLMLYSVDALINNCCDVNSDILELSPELYKQHVAPEM